MIDCKKFMETFQEVAESQQGKEENKDASNAAGLLEKLSVGDEKKEEVKETEKAGESEEKKEVEAASST